MNNEEKILEILEKHGELLESLTRSVSGIDSRLERLETGQAALEGRVTRMEGEEGFWRLGFDRMERMQTALEGRMERLETVLAEHGELLQKVDERSQRTAVMLEADVVPKLQTLYEGHQSIMDAITPKEQIEEMAADISVLRMASRSHSKEIAELKKVR